MKRNSVWWVVLAILILVAAFVISNQLNTNTGQSVDGGTSDRAPSTTLPPPAATLERPIGAIRSQVAFVHDGDTLFLQPEGTRARDDQIKVRLIGLDAPEVGEDAECFGYEARDYLRSLLPEGAQVWIMPDREEFDRYGRSLLYVWTMDDHSVNLDLVENGYSTALNIAPSNTYWKQFEAAEDAAYHARLGLWKACFS